jgi:hypothetical protein
MTINNLRIDEILKQELINKAIKTRLHPAFFSGVLLIIFYYLIKIIDIFFPNLFTFYLLFFFLELFLLAAGSIITYFYVLDYINTELVITDKRLIFKNGIKRKINSIPFGKIQELYINPKKVPLLGDFCDLVIICKENSDFINSYKLHLERLTKPEIQGLEKIVIDINHMFKSNSAGKIENITITSNKYLKIDMLALFLLLVSLIILVI